MKGRKSCHKFKLNEALQIEEKKLEKVLGVDCKVFEWNWQVNNICKKIKILKKLGFRTDLDKEFT